MKETRVTLKKIVLSIFMCLALVMGLMPMEEVKATSPTINTDATGSITIHKYTEGTVTGIPGTGSSSDTVPAGAAPIKGVEFTIYRVETDLDKFYDKDPDALPSVSNYTVPGSYTSYTGTTGDDGTYKFKDLPLGIYYVKETKTPDGVIALDEAFLVSVPMTTADGSDWLYDIHVYPKNKTTVGITLKKVNLSNETLSGVSFTLQKKKDDGTWENATKDDGSEYTLATDNNGLISVDGLKTGDYRFVETSIGSNVGYIMDGVTTYEFTANPDGTITYTPAGGTEQTNKTIVIEAKNEKPDITKQVEDRSNPGNYVNASDYSVGDTVNYKVDITVPSNITQLRQFKVVDTPTNLVDGTVTVTGATGAYTLTTGTPTNGFTIDFDPTKLTGGSTITLTYSAELKDTAVTTKDGNPNTIQLIYDNKILPSSKADGNPNPTAAPTPDPATDLTTIEDGAIVYTFQIGISKEDESNNGLDGVEFDLYRVATNGAITGDAAKALGLDSTKKWEQVDTGLTTTTIDGTKGQIVKKGLEKGTYALVETKTLEGYNLLSKAVEVELNPTYSVTMKETITGNTIKKNDIDKITINSNDSYTGVITEDTTIVNRKGFILPTTGGAGSFLFTLIGCAIMIGGFIIFRKTNAKKTDAA